MYVSLVYAKNNISNSKHWRKDKLFNNGVWTTGTLVKNKSHPYFTQHTEINSMHIKNINLNTTKSIKTNLRILSCEPELRQGFWNKKQKAKPLKKQLIHLIMSKWQNIIQKKKHYKQN